MSSDKPISATKRHEEEEESPEPKRTKVEEKEEKCDHSFTSKLAFDELNKTFEVYGDLITKETEEKIPDELSLKGNIHFEIILKSFNIYSLKPKDKVDEDAYNAFKSDLNSHHKFASNPIGIIIATSKPKTMDSYIDFSLWMTTTQLEHKDEDTELFLITSEHWNEPEDDEE